MSHLVEMAVSAFFLVCASAVGLVFFWRVRKLEHRISILLHAALTNTREIRQCIGRVEDGFSGLRKAENQRRLMLASLNSQMTDLNRMLSSRVNAAEPPVVPPQAANATETVSAATDHAVYSRYAGHVDPASRLPGYRTVRRETQERAVVENGAEASRQRKVRTIEQFFDQVGGFGAAPAVPDDTGKAAETNVTKLPVSPQPEKDTARAGVGLSEVFSRRRRVVNG